MNQIICWNCKHSVLHSPHCAICGAPIPPPKPSIWAQLPTGARVVVVIVAVGLMATCVKIMNQGDRPATSDTSKESVTPSKPSPPAQPPPALTPEQRAEYTRNRLAAAKYALADGYKPSGKDRGWGRVRDARQALEEIRQQDKEYGEAQKLLGEVKRREKEIEKWAKVTARELFAETVEKNYLEKGMDVSLTLSGPDKTTIKFKYVLMSRPLVYQLTNDSEFMGNLRKAGFKKVIFTDGYFHSWTNDI